MQDFRRLKVWQKAHEVTLAVYQATATFPRTETYALTSQLRRSISSIPSNIAEGCGRGSNADMVRFLYIALGSSFEADYQLQLAHDLGYIDGAVYEGLVANIDEVKRMLSALIQRAKRAGVAQLTTENLELKTP